MYRKVFEPFIYARHGLRIKLQRSGARTGLIAILLLGAAIQPIALLADTVPVRHTEGLMHGFLVLRTLEGKAIADVERPPHSERSLIQATGGQPDRRFHRPG